MILFIDNYDSFTYNLVSMMGALEGDLAVYRNDAITADEVRRMAPSGIVLSPGPGRPSEAGVCPALVREFAPSVPILGVCLGHQVITEVFGGVVARAPKPVHGKAATVFHDGTGLFEHVPNPLSVARYHSLAASESVSDCLRVQARSEDGVVMALCHRKYPCHGVQFHPESILTPDGMELLRAFLELCGSPQ